ncbi:hypothetical protein PE36_08041 [Moritella sp. PE36]|uniref:TniQ family protein n=1 Tax=Moritella sp. PE36 TaxID=58051 RepID=UPI0001568DB4|nr:TniQ family protein [Moritella sp. PE36]EDM65936.1 hypothetical protein PE36_08041 [Moritella sp. PE36]
MKLLEPITPYNDESLESYLLRIAEENGYQGFRELGHILWCVLYENDNEAAGAFPKSLDQLNIYHTNTNSSFRVRAIQFIEELTVTGRLPLLNLSIMNNDTTFLKGLKSVSYQGVLIPRCFIKHDGIPICSDCLRESPYIRQYWQLVPYLACHIHQCEMLSKCPECDEVINYQLTESITYCCCGYDLRTYRALKSDPINVELSKLVTNAKADKNNDSILYQVDLSHRYGALLWFYLQHNDDTSNLQSSYVSFGRAISYFSDWPNDLYSTFEAMVNKAEITQVVAFNKMPFSDVFGSLLLDASKLPSRNVTHNFILRDITSYLINLVRTHAKSKHPNIADTLLTILEVAALLSTSHEQIYRLYETGHLIIAVRLKQFHRLSVNIPAFHLRHVIELRNSRIPISSDYSTYLPAW